MLLELERKQHYKFLGVFFSNGRAHTLKAFGKWNSWGDTETLDCGLENQFEYIEYINEVEFTEVIKVIYTDSEFEAYELGLIDESGDFA